MLTFVQGLAKKISEEQRACLFFILSVPFFHHSALNHDIRRQCFHP